MDKIPFEDGVKLKNATVTIQEQEYEVAPAKYESPTPFSSFNLNKMQDNIETAINDIKPKMKDTGWKNFSWTNSDYIGTSQSSFTLNKWRVKDDILYVMVGVGSPNTIDSSNETEIARIPIVGNASFDTSKERIWTMGVGSAGSYGGFYIMQESSYISVYMKPHKVTNGQATNWFSAHFSVPLDETYVINE